MTVQTHVCLVSVQATPNLTPALDPGTRPNRAILVVSPDMERRAGWLEGVLRGRGVKVDRWQVEDPWNVEHLQLRILELLEREREEVESGSLALNATGGTKPMSIAAYEMFRSDDLPIFYVHPEKDRLIWLHPGGHPAVDLANRAGLEPFLLAHGATVNRSRKDRTPEQLAELTGWLVSSAGTFGKALGILNGLAMEAEKKLVSPPMDSVHLRNERLQVLIDRFSASGMISTEGKRLRFPDEKARFYVNGGWLEEHVYDVLRDLRAEVPSIQDLARSVDIVRETERGEKVPNELDVACLAGNRLYLVECKTRSWRREGPVGAGADALYRLDTLGDLLGGLQARAMLVSYRTVPPHDLRRAADLGIRVCAGNRLPELSAELRAWLP
jgi:hypothetical protein